MGSFSRQWEEIYRANTHMSIWPWSDLISYVYRYAQPRSADFQVLELGPGAGANIPLFKHLGVKYFAIEGSPSIVAALQDRFPEYRERIVAGDFTEHIPFLPGFNLVVDRGSVTHNTTEAIRRCVRNLHSLLRPDGIFIGIDWFSTRHGDYHNGESAEDAFTRTGFVSGQFKGVGRVHFSDEHHLRELFSGFEFIVLEHKTVESVAPEKKTFACWNIAAKKSPT